MTKKIIILSSLFIVFTASIIGYKLYNDYKVEQNINEHLKNIDKDQLISDIDKLSTNGYISTSTNSPTLNPILKTNITSKNGTSGVISTDNTTTGIQFTYNDLSEVNNFFISDCEEILNMAKEKNTSLGIMCISDGGIGAMLSISFTNNEFTTHLITLIDSYSFLKEKYKNSSLYSYDIDYISNKKLDNIKNEYNLN